MEGRMKTNLKTDNMAARVKLYERMMDLSWRCFEASVEGLLEVRRPTEVRDILLRVAAELEKLPDFHTHTPEITNPRAN